MNEQHYKNQNIKNLPQGSNATKNVISSFKIPDASKFAH